MIIHDEHSDLVGRVITWRFICICLQGQRSRSQTGQYWIGSLRSNLLWYGLTWRPRDTCLEPQRYSHGKDLPRCRYQWCK